MQQPFESGLGERLRPQPLACEQAQFRGETAIGECAVVADQKFPGRGQRTVDSGHEARERAAGLRMDLGRQGAGAQGQQTDLRLAREYQTHVEETVDTRGRKCIAAIDGNIVAR